MNNSATDYTILLKGSGPEKRQNEHPSYPLPPDTVLFVEKLGQGHLFLSLEYSWNNGIQLGMLSTLKSGPCARNVPWIISSGGNIKYFLLLSK